MLICLIKLLVIKNKALNDKIIINAENNFENNKSQKKDKMNKSEKTSEERQITICITNSNKALLVD